MPSTLQRRLTLLVIMGSVRSGEVARDNGNYQGELVIRLMGRERVLVSTFLLKLQ